MCLSALLVLMLLPVGSPAEIHQDSPYGAYALIDKLVEAGDEASANSLLEIWKCGDASMYQAAGQGLLRLAKKRVAQDQPAQAARLAYPLIASSLPREIRQQAEQLVQRHASPTQRQRWQLDPPSPQSGTAGAPAEAGRTGGDEWAGAVDHR